MSNNHPSKPRIPEHLPASSCLEAASSERVSGSSKAGMCTSDIPKNGGSKWERKWNMKRKQGLCRGL